MSFMDSAENNVLLIVAILSSLLLCALFTVIQGVFWSLSLSMVKKHEEEGDSRAELILKMLSDKPRILLNCIIVKVFGGALCTASTYILLDRTLSHVIIGWFNGNKLFAVFASTIILSVFLLVIFGEAVPEVMNLESDYERIRKIAKPIYYFMWLIYPITYLPIKLVFKIVSNNSYLTNQFASIDYEDEKDRYVNLAKEAGIIEEEEKEMISSVFEFGDTIAREVMVPRPDIVAMPINTSFDKLIEIVAEDGHSRFPVYDGSIDKIVGILYVKDILVKLKQIKKDYDLFKLLRKPFFVPETKNLNDLLREFQKRNQHLAIVVDEYGGVSGLVSIEDLLEEIVGEIVDEYDQEEQEAIIQVDDTTYNVDARQSMPDLEGKIDCKFEYEDAETVGGFVMEKLGRIPVQGEVFEVPQGKFKITETKGNRILKVQITLNK